MGFYGSNDPTNSVKALKEEMKVENKNKNRQSKYQASLISCTKTEASHD